MLVAIPVFLLWIYNLQKALKGFPAVRRMTRRSGDGVLIQARLAVFDPFAFATIELVIIGTLSLMMTFHPNPDSSLLSRWSIGGGTIIVSVLLGLAALFRRIADDRTLAYSRRDPRVSQKDWSDWSGAE